MSPDKDVFRRTFFLCWLLICLFASPAGALAVEGRLLSDGAPVSGGIVSAYSNAGLQGAPVGVPVPSDTDGRYTMDLLRGRYFLSAEWGNLWSYCGRNPVVVAGQPKQWIGFELLQWERPVYGKLPEEGLDGLLKGVVTWKGKPAGGVSISLYLDDEDNFRGMPFIRSVPTGPDGTFAIDLVPESRYYLVARRRASGRTAGPMARGDLFAYYRYNPVEVRGGESVAIHIPLTEKKRDRDIHAIGIEGHEPGFSGLITDITGHPVPGLHVFAYLDPGMEHHRPDAISSLTDRDGRYKIFLPRSGIYYVGARAGFGDSPKPGEYFGFYEGTADHSVTLDAGEFVDGLNISVRKVLAP